MRDLLSISKLMQRGSGKKGQVIRSFESAKEKLFRKKRERPLIILGLGVPLFLSFLFFYGIGRDRYFVKSEVVVRKPQESVTAGLNLATLIGGGNQGSIEDALFLRTYLNLLRF